MTTDVGPAHRSDDPGRAFSNVVRHVSGHAAGEANAAGLGSLLAVVERYTVLTPAASRRSTRAVTGSRLACNGMP